jgi:DNA-binding response OmpR family regulator
VVRDVLIVEDNKAFRKFLSLILARHGFTVHEAADGEEGLRTALDRRPWLILTDVRMPGMDGFEFCRRVRRHSLIRQTPLLFLSGWDDYKQRYQGLELGADDFVSKETPIKELLIRIQLLMRRYADLGVRARIPSGGSGGGNAPGRELQPADPGGMPPPGREARPHALGRGLTPSQLASCSARGSGRRSSPSRFIFSWSVVGRRPSAAAARRWLPAAAVRADWINWRS